MSNALDLKTSDSRRPSVSDLLSVWFDVRLGPDEPRIEAVYPEQSDATVLGHTASALVGRNPLTLVHAPDRERVSAALATWRQLGQRTLSLELSLLSHSGNVHRGELAARRMGDDLAIVHFRDVTERDRRGQVEREVREQLENEVAQARIEWRDTFDAVELPLVTVDEKCRIVRLNRAARELAGVPYARLVGRAFQTAPAHEPWRTALELLSYTLTHRLPAEKQARHDTGERVWDLATTPTDTAGARAILTIHDATNTARLQNEVRKAETMATLGELMAGVAHEVRNPLFGISATLDAFEAAFGAREEYARYLEVLRGELTRLGTLMADLLEYGHPPTLSTLSCDLAQVVDEGVTLSTASSTAGIGVHHLPPAAPRIVQIDRGRIVQVMINLIDNAVQHAHPGTVVTIGHEDLVSADGRAWYVVYVDDAGLGIAEEDRAKVFEPFFTRRVGGTGLGLSIVQRIVEQHGGTVGVGTSPAGGARLSFALRANDGE